MGTLSLDQMSFSGLRGPARGGWSARVNRLLRLLTILIHLLILFGDIGSNILLKFFEVHAFCLFADLIANFSHAGNRIKVFFLPGVHEERLIDHS